MRVSLLLVALVSVVFASSPAHATTVAATTNNGGSPGCCGVFSLGWQFTVDTPLLLTALSRLDSEADSTFPSSTARLFNWDTTFPLADATVVAGVNGEVNGMHTFYYASTTPTSVLLLPGTNYLIAVEVSANDYVFDVDVTLPSEVNYVTGRATAIGATGIMPNVADTSSSSFPIVRSGTPAAASYFGANFKFDRIDHYMVYGLLPGAFTPIDVDLEDQFDDLGVPQLVTLTDLSKVGVPVSKAIAPGSPSEALLLPDKHLTWYKFSGPGPMSSMPFYARLKNQFTTENKGAIWTVGDAEFLLVPAIKDGVGIVDLLGQHWKCYAAADLFDPDVTVNMKDQFQLASNVVVVQGRYLCNPVKKNSGPMPPLPEEHLACYEISGAPPLNPPLNPSHDLEDQFGAYSVSVLSPELLCVPSLKFLPEPGVLLSFGPGLLLLAWLDRRRRGNGL